MPSQKQKAEEFDECIRKSNSGKPLVSFIQIDKKQPTRKTIKGQLISCNEEKTDDYQYAKYLEQNRYSRLFNELELVGEGGFGKVYKAQHVLD